MTTTDNGLTTTDYEPACCAPVDADSASPSGSLDSCCAPSVANGDAPTAIEQIREQETPPEVASARSAGFRLLLETGTPVKQRDWAERAKLSESELEEILGRASVNGRVELDAEGRLVGIAGLTVQPTPHEITIDGAERWTWCALDAVGILGALETDGMICSVDPQSGASIEITVRAGVPDADAVLFILGGYDGGNVRDDWCPLVNFFEARSDAELWVSENDLGGDIVTVREIAEEAAAMWRPVNDPTAPQDC